MIYTGVDPQSKIPSSSPPSYFLLAPSVPDENSEILSVLSKDITRKVLLLPPGGKRGEPEGGQKEKPRQKTPPLTTSPSPPPQRTVITKLGVIENDDAAMADETSTKSSHVAMNKPKRVSTSTTHPLLHPLPKKAGQNPPPRSTTD